MESLMLYVAIILEIAACKENTAMDAKTDQTVALKCKNSKTCRKTVGK